jgi:hypothetical protein
MDEANRSLQHAPTKAQLHTMHAAVATVAKREALKAISPPAATIKQITNNAAEGRLNWRGS